MVVVGYTCLYLAEVFQGKKLPQDTMQCAEVSDEDEATLSLAETLDTEVTTGMNNNDSEFRNAMSPVKGCVGNIGYGGVRNMASSEQTTEVVSKVKLSGALSCLIAMQSVSFKSPDQAASVGECSRVCHIVFDKALISSLVFILCTPPMAVSDMSLDLCRPIGSHTGYLWVNIL